MVFKNVKYKNLVVFDAEYNEGDIIQFSGIMFRKVQDDIFQVSKSINLYIKLPHNKQMNSFIERFTGITDKFLEQDGEDLFKAKRKIYEFLEAEGDILFVSHGLTNDRKILLDNGIDFYASKDESQDYYGSCTYNMAKRILNREKNLSLTDIAMEAGWFIFNGHNAFDDAWANVAVFSLLKKLEDEKNEKIL
ncbi:MAG: exonuclease domain-containing protein [Bacillota bacterium]